jgi:catechol 2,3-dioxygenase-like lactoylglutathione lyase family enzyme
MAVALDHMSVATRDKVATAEFYARIFGVKYEGPRRDFAPVKLSTGLTLNFEDAESYEPRHYAFRLSGDEFDGALSRLQADAVPFGSSTSNKDGQIYDRNGLRGLYFGDPNGHGLELITPDGATPAR